MEQSQIVENESNDFEDLAVILLLVNSTAFQMNTKSYNLQIFGKSMKDWVKDACYGASICETLATADDGIVPLAKAHLSDKKYTAVLYSDTPLLTKQNLLEIMDYVKMKELSVCKLTRGYIFETNYLKSIDKIINPQTCYFEEEDFITCYNLKQLSMISDIMKNRILYFHMKNGVMFFDCVNTYIDADVNIGKNVIIGSNNIIKGDSFIGDNVVLKQNNCIENSVIMDSSSVESSIIKDSIIGKSVIIEGYCHITNQSIVGDGAIIKPFVKIEKCKIEPLKTIKSFTHNG